MWKKKLVQGLWIAAGIATIVLLGAAMRTKNHKICVEVDVKIKGDVQHTFVDEEAIKKMMNSNGELVGREMIGIDLKALETLVEKNEWIRNAEMFFDNKQVLNVTIEEREPIARIFTNMGSSFYLDTSGMKLPLSEKISARVVAFTGCPELKEKMVARDSAVMKDVLTIANYIMADSFWMAETAQINMNEQGKFELIPVIGNHIVELGSAENLEEKLNRLYSFYHQVFAKGGDKYEKLNVEFEGQVVATKRGFAKAVSDTSHAMQPMIGVDSLHTNAMVVDTAQAIRQRVTTTPKRNVVVQPKRNNMAAPKPKPPVKRNGTAAPVRGNNKVRVTTNVNQR
jgi:cell division protein FtsQ